MRRLPIGCGRANLVIFYGNFRTNYLFLTLWLNLWKLSRDFEVLEDSEKKFGMYFELNMFRELKIFYFISGSAATEVPHLVPQVFIPVSRD